MAGRPIGKRHQEDVRRKIQSSQLINRLTSHALGKADPKMDSSQVTAALGLLKKAVPDLSAIEHSTDPDKPLKGVLVWGSPE